MKKILSVILVLSMVLALGTTAFADGNWAITAGKTEGVKYENNVITKANGILVSDVNGFLVIDTIVVNDGFVAFNVTAPATAEGKVAKLVITDNTKDKNVIETLLVDITAPEKPVAPQPEDVLDAYDLPDATNLVVDMGELNGISAALYNKIKAKNYETITFVGNGYEWTIVRGDYTKMNVDKAIYFGAELSYSIKDTETVKGATVENAIMNALGTKQADLFYVTIADNFSLDNVADKPALVVTVNTNWVDFNNKFSVTAYKYNGETVAKVAEGLAVKPTSGKLTLNLTKSGLYVFVADNYTVNPTAPAEKPNASTGANSAAAVVALAVMAVAAVASKKIVK